MRWWNLKHKTENHDTSLHLERVNPSTSTPNSTVHHPQDSIPVISQSKTNDLRNEIISFKLKSKPRHFCSNIIKLPRSTIEMHAPKVSFFTRMIDSEQLLNSRDKDGNYIIDWNSETIGNVFQFLKTGKLDSKSCTLKNIEEVDSTIRDFDYFMLDIPIEWKFVSEHGKELNDLKNSWNIAKLESQKKIQLVEVAADEFFKHCISLISSNMTQIIEYNKKELLDLNRVLDKNELVQCNLKFHNGILRIVDYKNLALSSKNQLDSLSEYVDSKTFHSMLKSKFSSMNIY